ncbi:MAG TPA: 4Fe-4S single cluster domain-containing protein, partial [bacterium]|nr:4Fe-4S single cluster domain-containing protein [bacterium]
IWVQGCPKSCPGCISPDARPVNGGESVSVSELAEWILGTGGIEGVTISGGEPMLQSEALFDLITEVRQACNLGVVCYTGFTIEELIQEGTSEQKLLLKEIDMLIDGPYIQEKHENLLWRGSSNQRLIPLSGRYRESIVRLTPNNDRTAGMQFFLDHHGIPGYYGVPHVPGFDEKFLSEMERRGVNIRKEKETRQ